MRAQIMKIIRTGWTLLSVLVTVAGLTAFASVNGVESGGYQYIPGLRLTRATNALQISQDAKICLDGAACGTVIYGTSAGATIAMPGKMLSLNESVALNGSNNTVAGAMTFSTASGSNALTLATGARVDLGGGASDYFYSDGTSIGTPANLYSTLFRSNAGSGSTGVLLSTGAQLDLGSGANDYLYSDATNVITPAPINAPSVYVDFVRERSVNQPLKLAAQAADSATAIAVQIDNSTLLSTAGSKLFALNNAGTEQAYFDRRGALVVEGPSTAEPGVAIPTGSRFCLNGSACTVYLTNGALGGMSVLPDADNARSLGSSTRRWSSGFFNTVEADTVQAPSGSTAVIKGRMANSATAVGTVIDTTAAYATNGAKLLSVRSLGSEKAYVTYDGDICNASSGSCLSTVDSREVIFAAYYPGVADGLTFASAAAVKQGDTQKVEFTSHGGGSGGGTMTLNVINGGSTVCSVGIACSSVAGAVTSNACIGKSIGATSDITMTISTPCTGLKGNVAFTYTYH